MFTEQNSQLFVTSSGIKKVQNVNGTPKNVEIRCINRRYPVRL